MTTYNDEAFRGKIHQSSLALDPKWWHKLHQYWHPEAVPPTILAGDFGLLIHATHQNQSREQHQVRFQMIEDLQANGDDEVGTAIATGLLESLIHKAEDPAGDQVMGLELLWDLCGKACREYWIAYDKSQGITPRG